MPPSSATSMPRPGIALNRGDCWRRPMTSPRRWPRKSCCRTSWLLYTKIFLELLKCIRRSVDVFDDPAFFHQQDTVTYIGDMVQVMTAHQHRYLILRGQLL